MKRIWHLLMAMVLALSFVAACTAAPTEEAATEEPAAVEPAEEVVTEQPAAAEPTELRVVIVGDSPLEEPWNAIYTAAWDRAAAQRPHGLNITYQYVESVATTDVERVMREYAETGEYDILVFHAGAFRDAAELLVSQYPDVLVLANGSNYEALGGNFLYSNVFVHECAYLLGIIAGMMTTTDRVGAIGGFPYPNVNLPINAFFEGARSVNPDVQQVVAYLESWYDPTKAAEATAAQISAGADYIYAERYGVFEAARSAGVYAFGHYADQNALAPDVVVSSTLALWDPSVAMAIDMWWDHAVNGVPYDAPTEVFTPSMAEGGCAIAPYHGFDSTLPQDVKDAVENARQAIINGTLVVPFNDAPAESQ